MITVQLQEKGPITEMDEALLERRDSFLDNDHEITTAIEYWLGDRCVHRSVHVHLKQGLSLKAEQGAFGG
jgi:hypothetical protein